MDGDNPTTNHRTPLPSPPGSGPAEQSLPPRGSRGDTGQEQPPALIGSPESPEAVLPVLACGYIMQVGDAARNPAWGAGRQPLQKVTFDIQNYGSVEAYYHQVIRREDYLVLVYDLRFVGPKSFPGNSQASIGMHVDGTDHLFLVRTTGIRFVVGCFEVCLLMVVGQGSQAAYLTRGPQNDLPEEPPICQNEEMTATEGDGV